MLILTRKVGENIIIDDKIKIMVTQVKGTQISIGIEAPLDVSILREEVAEKYKNER